MHSLQEVCVAGAHQPYVCGASGSSRTKCGKFLPAMAGELMPMMVLYVPVVPYGAAIRLSSAPARMLSISAHPSHRTSPARDNIRPVRKCTT